MFAPGRASIDHRLRYAPEVQNVVIGLLESLDYRIRTCRSHSIMSLDSFEFFSGLYSQTVNKSS